MSGFKKIDQQAAVQWSPKVTTDDTSYLPPGVTRAYVLGGKAIFRVSNQETRESLTFKVRRTRKEWPKGSRQFTDVFYINVKVPGGRYPYRYLGVLNPETGTIRTTAQSAFLPGSKEYNTAAWATQAVLAQKWIAPVYRIEHQGKCGRCAKPLLSKPDHARGVHASCR